MKAFIREGRSRRHGFDGWALRVRGAAKPFDWTTSTTREEAREVRRDLEQEIGSLLDRLEIVKVRITVEVVE